MQNPFFEMDLRILVMIAHCPVRARSLAEEEMGRQAEIYNLPDMPIINEKGEFIRQADAPAVKMRSKAQAKTPRKKRVMSAAGRKKIAVAQKKRWAKWRKEQQI